MQRYFQQEDPVSWCEWITKQKMPSWINRFEQLDLSLHQEIQTVVSEAFGESNLPILRRRYNTYLHRQRQQTRAIDISEQAHQALKQVMIDYQLDSYSEVILWLSRELCSDLVTQNPN
ncbi:MAG: hypothetical protein R3Y10_06510 [Ferrimonas sp.]